MYYIEKLKIVNTHRTGSACQSNTGSNVSSNPWVLSIAGITCVSNIVLCIYILFYHFFHCLLNSFLLHQFPNYRVKWDYPFTKDMQNGGVDNVISDICTFLHRGIFHVDGVFFDKTGILVEFPQLCNYERFTM
jgi:hypothetical protein